MQPLESPDLQKEIERLHSELARRDAIIRDLKLKVQEKTAVGESGFNNELERSGALSENRYDKIEPAGQRGTIERKVTNGTENSNQIRSLQSQMKVLERKAVNAKHLSDAHEKYAKEAHKKELQSKADASKLQRQLRLTREKYQELENDLQMNHLEACCGQNRARILAIEKSIRDILTDPSSSKTGQKRRLRSLKKELIEAQSKQDSQVELLKSLREKDTLNAKMRQASCRGDTSSIKQLLGQGVSVNVPDKTGFSAFKYACGGGHLDAARLMAGAADLNDRGGRTTALAAAARNGHAAVVRFLLGEGADAETKDDAGNTALLIACDGGHRDCVLALLRTADAAEVNAANRMGNTGLHLCALRNRDEIASLLLDRGADASVENASGMTPIEAARVRRHGETVLVLSGEGRY